DCRGAGYLDRLGGGAQSQCEGYSDGAADFDSNRLLLGREPGVLDAHFVFAGLKIFKHENAFIAHDHLAQETGVLTCRRNGSSYDSSAVGICDRAIDGAGGILCIHTANAHSCPQKRGNQQTDSMQHGIPSSPVGPLSRKDYIMEVDAGMVDCRPM